MASKMFLVTGGSGYLAMHVINQLLQQGHRVRTTLRNLEDTTKVEPIKKLALNTKYPIEIVKADLLDADIWHSVVKDINYVIHVASPLLVKEPENEIEVQNLIMKPAIDGTLNVLNACLNTSVERVVVTSSGLTIFGMERDDKTYSEADWANFDKLKTHYSRSKYLSEKACWDFYSKHSSSFGIAVIHPVLILGPVLNFSSGTSVTRFKNLFGNKIEKIPNLNFPVCDVRDVATAHIKAAFKPEAVGNRHLIVSSDRCIPMKVWADILNEEFSSKGFKIPTEVDDQLLDGLNTKIDTSRMTNILEIIPTDFKSTIIDMANSLLEYEIVKKPE